MKIAVIVVFLASACVYSQAPENAYANYQAFFKGGKCDIGDKTKEANKNCVGEANPSMELFESLATDKDKLIGTLKCINAVRGYSPSDIVTKENATSYLDIWYSFLFEEGRAKVLETVLSCLDDEKNKHQAKLGVCMFPTMQEVCLG